MLWLAAVVSTACTARAPEQDDDLVVLLDDLGHACGTAPRATVHHGETPLHLAFSCYLFAASQVLITRRAATKRAFPGVWTNSVCGHPAPGETLVSAVRRRARQELGVAVAGVRLVLPAFRYRAGQHGVVEHEMCPVLVGDLTGEPAPDPAEVADHRLVPWTTFAADVLSGRREVSPWCALQVAELAALGPQPRDWTTADPALLPPAARLG